MRGKKGFFSAPGSHLQRLTFKHQWVSSKNLTHIQCIFLQVTERGLRTNIRSFREGKKHNSIKKQNQSHTPAAPPL